MANSNRVVGKSGKKPAASAAVKKKRERRAVTHTSSFGSLTVLRNRLRRVRDWVFIFLAAVMVIGFGVSVPSMRWGEERTGGDVAKINGHVIDRESFERAVEGMKNSPYAAYMGGGPTQDLLIRSMVLDQLQDHILKLDAADREGNRAGRKQVEQRIEQVIDAQIQQAKAAYKTPKEFQERYLKRRLGASNEEEGRRKLRDRITTGEWMQATREQIRIENLERKIRKQAETMPLDKAKPEDIEVRVRHILIRTAPAPAPGAPKPKVTGKQHSDAEARKLAERVLAEVKAGASFEKVARQKSEDELTKAKGGDLDWRAKGGFYDYPEIEAAVLALQPGQTSGVLKSRQGYHIVKVEGRRFSPSRYWMAYTESLKKNARIEVHDPVLVAYRQMTAEAKDEKARKRNTEKAIALFRKALKDTRNPETRASIYFTLGNLYTQMKNTREAAAAFAAATTERPSPEIYMAWGDSLERIKDTEGAIRAYTMASKMASDTTSQQHMYTHTMLQAAFTKLKQPKLAAAEKAWVDKFRKNQPAGGMGFPGGNIVVR